MHFYPVSYSYCRSGSDVGLGLGQRRYSTREPEPTDSGESTLSDLDESESGSGVDVDPNLPYPGIAPIALGYLSQTTRPRSWCLALISNPWFERISMMVILLNCVTLGMYQPCMDDTCKTNRCKILQLFDDFIFAFFSLEMTIKMVAMGVWGKGSYLADSWNRLDLFIVLAGAVEYCAKENMNLSAIRTIRVLRPLRAINRIPSMRILVMLLLDTLPMLGNVLLLCFFVFFIFGIVGVQLWQGILRQRCFIPTGVYSNITFPVDFSPYYQTMQETEYICSKKDHSGMHYCTDLPAYKLANKTCSLTYEQSQEKAQGCVNWHQYYTLCKEGGENPFQGTISFDNIGLAWVAIFLVISLEGWTDIMYYVQDAHSFWDWIYFVLLIVIGSFFMINLCLVVIATQFSETKKREMERMRLERARFQSSSTLASSTNNSEPTSCYAEIVKYIAHLWRRSKRRLMKKIRLFKYRREQRRERKIMAGETIRLNYNKRHHPCCPRLRHVQQGQQQQTQIQVVQNTQAVSRTSSISVSEIAAKEQKLEERELGSGRPGLLKVPSNSNQDMQTNNSDGRRPSVMFSDVVLLHGESTPTSGNSPNLLIPTMETLDKKNVCSSEKMTQTGDGNIWQISSNPNQQQLSPTQQQSTQDYCDLINGEAMTCQELLALGAINAALPTGQIALDTFFDSLSKGIGNRPKNGEDIYVQQLPDDDFTCCQDMWHSDNEYKNVKRSKLYIWTCLVIKAIFRVGHIIRKYIRKLVEHKYFQQGILLAILINTLSMGIEYHDQPETLTTAVEISNIVFSAIFAVEMLLKVIAEGPFRYIANGFNVFDGIVVILSAIELCQRFMGNEHTDSGLSVLRTFRLLRILKLVRFMPNLRRQLFVMLRTMDNVAVFFSLLILFIFIFSILGMNLFGCKFCEGKTNEGKCSSNQDEVKDRKNFDSLLWAIVTVFQILTQEDWNMVLSNGMAKTSHWSALYFVALMTFGNYVLFNLLVAILVEGFSSERNERREREQREIARRKMSCMLEASLRGSSDDSSKSFSSSGSSYVHDVRKNCWRSAEELRKLRYYDINTPMKPTSYGYFDCKDSRSKECCLSRSVAIYEDIDPKCNIQKESNMLNKKPPRQTSPPIITHTAATPQDSPSTTLDDYPEFKYSVTPVGDIFAASALDCAASNMDSGNKASASAAHGLLKPPTLSPPPLTFRQFERPPDEPKIPIMTAKIITHNERIGSKTMTYSEKISVPVPTSTKSAEKTKAQEPQPVNGKIQRKSSWKLSSRPSMKKKKKRSGSDSDAIPLNNGRDHSQCNGGGVTRHASLRNDSLLQSSIQRIQNDTQSDTPNNKSAKGLSPQNSLRGRSNASSSIQQISWTPTLTRHNSLTTTQASAQLKINQCNQITKNNSPTISREISYVEPKSVNLSEKREAERSLPRIKLEDCISSSENAEEGTTKLKKFLMMIEPKGCMKERDDYSLYIFPPNNRIRKLCSWLVYQKWFDNMVLLFIAMNCITLAMERPNIPPDSPERYFLATTNYLFTVVFATEMLIKVVACGMCYGPDAYFTSGWNIMDGSLVIISIVDLLMSLISESSPKIFGILRVFRLLRSLRPLRVINRAPGLKLVVQTLLSSLRPIGNIVLICCTFFIIFGILGVQLFKGAFHYCKGENTRGVKNRTECENRGFKWDNQKYNFDDLGQALMSLFVLSSRDGWVNIMYSGLDAVGVDQEPQINYSEWRLLYFIAFILLVGFFVLNMFVGVVVENFHRCREEQEKEERVRRAAKRALQMEKRRRKMNEPPYYINYSPWRLFIHNVVTSKYFDLAIAAVIGLNVVTMATESYKMPDILSYILKIFNYFFTAVFILESTMKLIALGFMLYMKDKWNQLDVGIVILSVVGIILEELKSNIIPINPTVLRVMRVMRIARVLKLLKMAKGIRALLDTVMQALPQVGNLGLLFFLLFFIFAALGVELFGRLECSEKHPCQGLGEHAHFANFGMAFLTLFRVATGDNWNGIMKDTLREECVTSADCLQNCCVSHVIAPIYFVIFVLMAQFVLVNVVVAVLMKHLEESHKHLEDEQDMDNQLEREFQEKQELEERRELCLALQMDSECMQSHYKPLTKVLSLPSNFTYNPPGTKVERHPSFPKARRQTLHSQQPIVLSSNLDDIRNIDESISDIYSIRDVKNFESYSDKNRRVNVDDYKSFNQTEPFLKTPEHEEKYPLKNINETSEASNHLLMVPTEHKPMHRLYGSTKHLFLKQKSFDITEETPFLSPTALAVPETSFVARAQVNSQEKRMPKHDSQESVQRIITERRKRDENLKDINQYDIYEVNKGEKDTKICESMDEQRDYQETKADECGEISDKC